MSQTTTSTTAANHQPSSPKIVKSTLNYYLDPSKGGHTSYQIGVSSYYRRKFDTQPVEITNIRGFEDEFSLDRNGFQHAKHTSVEKEFVDDDVVRKRVYEETGELIKKLTGATRVHTFSHIIRRDSREAAEQAVATDPSLSDPNAPYQKVVPARFIHIDFSEVGAHEIFRDNFDRTEGERLAKTRWGIINVWRAIKPVRRDPLAVCDAQSAREEDLMPVVSMLPPKGSGQYADVSGGERFELYYKRRAEGERWYFAEGMQPEEVLLIKCFDSRKKQGFARWCPHSAFEVEGTENDGTRESIEVRSLVFWEDQKV